MRQYLVRTSSMRGDGLYLIRAQDVDEWVLTSSQRKATRFTSLYNADVAADAFPDARVVRVRRRAAQQAGPAKGDGDGE